MTIAHTARAAAVVLVAAVSAPAAAEQRTPPTILDFISLWLQTEYQLGRPSAQPDIVAMSSAELITRRYGEGAVAVGNEIVALYDAEARAIRDDHVLQSAGPLPYGPRTYTCVIPDPPCGKFNQTSEWRPGLCALGTETVSLQTAFAAITPCWWPR